MISVIVHIANADDFYAELLLTLDTDTLRGLYAWSEEGPLRRGAPRGRA